MAKKINIWQKLSANILQHMEKSEFFLLFSSTGLFVIFNFYKHVDAKSLKIWKILAKNVQCFIMFALVSGFSKSYITLQLNDWKSGKQIVAKSLQIWAILAKMFSIYFVMILLVKDFSKRYSSTLQLKDWKSGKQIITKTLQI